MTTQTTHSAEPQGARFRFKSKGLEVEFEGKDDFLTAQIEHLKPAFERELRRIDEESAKSAPASAPAAAPGAASATTADVGGAVAGAPSLEDFYRRARSREGRGALQEMILIFAYFLREFRGKEEFGIENLNACFRLVGVTPPKSLANTMGIMKRTQKFFHSGSRRGQYALTDKGVAYVKRLIGS
jgi:hypothetical protein